MIDESTHSAGSSSGHEGSGFNVSLIVKLLIFTVVLVLIYSSFFHVLMTQEGQQHSFVTGIYWTMTVMTTVGLGDVTFQNDIGRLYTILVMLSGMAMLLVVLPFAFLQFLFLPWLQNRIKMSAPRMLPAKMSGHVVISHRGPIGEGLVVHLRERGIPYVIMEPQPEVAAAMHREGISVVYGDPEDVESLRRVRLENARLLIANGVDTTNTNVILTAHEVAAGLPIIALASHKDSIDVLQLSGATQVLPLKHWLGRRLANRVGGAQVRSHVVGMYRDMVVAEVPIRNTSLENIPISETRLREDFGVNILGVWRYSQFYPISLEYELTPECVLIVIASRSGLKALDDQLFYEHPNPDQVILIGAGRVGSSAVEALINKGVTVHVIEKDKQVLERLPEGVHAVLGDASDLTVMKEAGLMEASTAILTTHDDSMNIYLASYCRHLNPRLRIISRITHERNVEAVHRAGADFALSFTTLGVAAILSELDEKSLAIAGGTLNLFSEKVPHAFIGKTLRESGVGSKTGLIIVALEQEDGSLLVSPSPEETLHANMKIVMVGEDSSRKHFGQLFKD